MNISLEEKIRIDRELYKTWKDVPKYQWCEITPLELKSLNEAVSIKQDLLVSNVKGHTYYVLFKEGSQAFPNCKGWVRGSE